MAEPTIDKLGKYRILNKLGQGGFGDVYLAEDTMLGSQVALKILAAHYLRNPTVVKRFRHEARAAARLHHPNIVRIHDLGEANGVIYLAMECLPGRNLAQLITDEGPLPLARVAGLVGQIASALDYAHNQGLIHRDVKPANVVVDDQDHATLTDFGLVKAAEGTEFSVLEIAEGSEQFTSGGSLIGTPEYMAPEQAEPGLGQVDGRTDLYALGVIAYQMLTGRLPFKADTPVATLRAHVDLEPPPPGQWVDLPEEAAAALLRALAKKPADRWAQAGDFARTLAEAAQRQEAIRVGEQEVAALYDQARTAVERYDWTRALALCGQVMDRQPDYQEVDALFMQANEGLTRQKQWEAQQGELAALYDKAEEQEKGGELEAAIVTLQQIVAVSGDYVYRDAPQRLAQAVEAKERAEAQRRARIEGLRGQAMGLAGDLQTCLEDLSALLPGDPDLARQQQLTKALQARLAGEPVKDEQALPAVKAGPPRPAPQKKRKASERAPSVKPKTTELATVVWSIVLVLVLALILAGVALGIRAYVLSKPVVKQEITIAIPATTAEGSLTGVVVEVGDLLTFQSEGSWCWGGETICSTPDGTAGRPLPDEHPTVLEGEPFGKLIGRVGNQQFAVGSNAKVTAPASGELILLMNDRVDFYKDNSGSITVTITVSRSR